MLYYFASINLLTLGINKNEVIDLNNNLNKIAEHLKSKGVKLVYMPCADKYNMYEPYIINNPYPGSQFFENIRPLQKDYIFIDTKKYLKEELDKGVQDLYYQDDSHWTNKAPEIIFKQVKFN